MNDTFFLLLLVLGGYAVGAIIPVLLSVARGAGQAGMRRQRLIKNLGYAAALGASLAGCALSALLLISGNTLHVELQQTLPFGPMALHADRLSAFFLGVVSVLGAAVSVYSLGYTSDLLGKSSVSLLVSLYNGFLLSMVIVVLAGHAVLFLFAWEAMSLTTFFLINHEHRDPSTRRAAFLYVVMTHAGTALLAIMFLLLYQATGSFSFDAFHAAGAKLPSTAAALLFLLALGGFGTKAGIIPLHIWLPEAHPAAPTNVSALMSGVMIKTGVYGLVRVLFDFLGSPLPAWYGLLLLGLAVVSSVLGVLYALMEHDLKRLLAYHSIENIGIILIGVGAALLFSSCGYPALATIALVAGLFHVFNHALFKGLLFLGAGSLVHATHTRNIEEMGGLARRLPWTSAFFLTGAVAISALPPLNGFVSEWLTYQALLAGFAIPELVVKIAVPLTVALLALTGALAAACFVKAYGIAFLGAPRSGHAQTAKEAPATMLVGMGLLAVLCVAFGVAPGFMLALLNPLVSSILPVSGGDLIALQGTTVSLPGSGGAGIAPALLALLLMAGLLVPLGAGLMAGKRRVRRAMTWACGLEKLDPRMQYTATGFSKPIRMIFSNVFHARHEIEVSEDASPYFHPRIRFELRTESLFLKHLYEPVYALVIRSARRLRRIQTGRIQSYLAYIFVVLVLLLLFAR